MKIIKADRIITGDGKTVLKNSAVAINGNQIAAIGNLDDLTNRFPDAVVDIMDGCTLLPGLIDMHIHGCAGFDASDAMTALLPGFTLLRLCSMLGTMGVTVTKDELLALNRQLNEIPQPGAAQEQS